MRSVVRASSLARVSLGLLLTTGHVLSAATLRPSDQLVLAPSDLPPGYQLVSDSEFETRELVSIRETEADKKRQRYTMHERRQELSTTGQAKEGDSGISVWVGVFNSTDMATAYCEQMEVFVFDGTELRLDRTWHTSRNDLGDPRLADNGGSIHPDPASLVIRYANVICRITAAQLHSAATEGLDQLGRAWIGKVVTAGAEIRGTREAGESPKHDKGTKRGADDGEPTVLTSPELIIDETGQLTQGDIAALETQLARLREKYGVTVALVITGFLTEDAQQQVPRDYFIRLREEGKLSEPAALCLLWTGQGQMGIRWHRDEKVNELLPWEKVLEAWTGARSKPFGAPLAQEMLARLLGSVDDAGGPGKATDSSISPK